MRNIPRRKLARDRPQQMGPSCCRKFMEIVAAKTDALTLGIVRVLAVPGPRRIQFATDRGEGDNKRQDAINAGRKATAKPISRIATHETVSLS